NEGQYLRRTVHSLLDTLPGSAELIIVDDCSSDGSAGCFQGCDQVVLLKAPERLGASGARNFGAQNAQGEIIVFADAHVDISGGWLEPFTEALMDSQTGAVGPAICDMVDRTSKGYGLRFIDAALNFEWCERQSWDPYLVPVLSAAFMPLRREFYSRIVGF